MNVLLLVVDSLRASSLRTLGGGPSAPRTPFFDRLCSEMVHFRRAHATECWTLPTHLSLFTGLLPSQHGAHFQTMEYGGGAPTLAEILAQRGYQTEVVTRNSLFDGTVPGATRGFARLHKPLGKFARTSAAAAIALALVKPRMKRFIRDSGFFHLAQKRNRDFVTTLARMGIPADRLALDLALERMQALRRRGQPFFVFVNLYDVHIPYPPREDSPLSSFDSLDGWFENLVVVPFTIPRVSRHDYLRPGFTIGERSRRHLLRRYHRAIELMDGKLAAFHAEARRTGLLDDTLVVVTSDHGEGFGEHGLYCHDASVYQTHLHVPLWIHHPRVAPRVVEDVVSTGSLYRLVRTVAEGAPLAGTLLDPNGPASAPVALAEHFHYPHTVGLAERFKHNLAAAIIGRHKLVVQREGLSIYDLDRDPGEMAPRPGSIVEFAELARRDGLSAKAIDAAVAHLSRWIERLKPAAAAVNAR